MEFTRTLDLRDMRFALSGASGFIGRHLVAMLQSLGAEVVALRRSANPSLPFSTALAPVLDFNDRHACAAALRRISPTHLIHLGGYAHSDRSIDAISRSLDNNLVSAMNFMLGAMDATPEARMVLAGTLETSSPWNGPVEVGSPYGISKVMVEVLSGSLQRLYGANVINAKIGMTYGPDDPNEHRLVPTVVRKLLRDERPRLSSGVRQCDWVFVEDVAEGLIRSAVVTHNELPPSIDIGSGTLTSIREVTTKIEALVGSSASPQYQGELDRPNEQERAANIIATHRVLGWHPSVTLDAGLARTVRWYRRRNGEQRKARRGRVAMALRPGAAG